MSRLPVPQILLHVVLIHSYTPRCMLRICTPKYTMIRILVYRRCHTSKLCEKQAKSTNYCSLFWEGDAWRYLLFLIFEHHSTPLNPPNNGNHKDISDVAASASSAFHIPWRGIRSEDMKGPRQPHPEINTNINFRLSSQTNINRKPQFHSQVKRIALPKCVPFKAYTSTTYLPWIFCAQSIFSDCDLSQYKVIWIQLYLEKPKSNWLILSMKGKWI